MGIQQRPVSLHWNYFSTLEDDVIELARWIEPDARNYECYSLELARLLMTACAEVDVVAKLVCKTLDPNFKATGVLKYQELIVSRFPTISDAKVDIPRYGLTLNPWANWNKEKNPPFWWQDNNKVKHIRSEHFHKATLKNVLNAVAALLNLLIIYEGERNWHFPFMPKLFLTNAFCESIDGDILYFPPNQNDN